MKRNKLMEELREQITPEIRELVDNEGFKCPYNDFSCIHVDINGISIDSSCDKCRKRSNEKQ